MMTLAEQIAQLKAAMKAIVDGAQAEGRDLTDEEITTLDTSKSELEVLQTKAEQVQKSLAYVAGLADSAEHLPDGVDVDTPGPVEAKSIGEAFTSSPAYRAFRKAHPSGVGEGTPVRIGRTLVPGGAKATIFTTTTTPDTPRVAPIFPDKDELTILDLVTTGSMSSNSFEYVAWGDFVSNAAIVPEGELKPLSDFTTQLKDAKAYTYADGVDVTNQALADEGALRTYLDTELRYAVRDKIEDVLLNGNGVGGQPAGILNTTGVQQQAFDTDVVRTIAQALKKVKLAKGTATAILMSISDAWDLALLQDANKQYYGLGPFGAPVTPRLWGVPIVPSARIPDGTAVVGDFRQVALLERESLTVEAFNQHKDYAQRNLTYIRAEWRGAQLIWRPGRLAVADLTAA